MREIYWRKKKKEKEEINDRSGMVIYPAKFRRHRGNTFVIRTYESIVGTQICCVVIHRFSLYFVSFKKAITARAKDQDSTYSAAATS